MRETELNPPVKAFLEALGYAVRARSNTATWSRFGATRRRSSWSSRRVFTLGLVFQGIARQDVTENVYLGVPPFPERTTRRKDALALCRRLGLGLLTVRLEPGPLVESGCVVANSCG